jgi:MFS family permease
MLGAPMRHYLNHVRAFTRDARLFLIANIVLALGTSAATVFSTLYFRAIGYDALWVGWVTTANQVGGALGTLPTVLLIDRIGRRRSIVLGASISLLTWGAALLSPARELTLSWMAVSGAANVLYGLAVVPLLAEVSTSYERTTLFTTRDGLATLSLFAGGLFVGGLPALIAPGLGVGPESAEAYRAVLLGSAAFRLLALLPLMLIHDDHAGTKSATPGAEAADAARNRVPFIHYLNPRVLAALHTPVVRIGLPLVIVYFAGSLVFPFLPLYLKDRFAAGDQLIGVTLGFINLSIGIGALAAPLLVQWLGRPRVIVAGALLSGLGILLMTFGARIEIVLVAAVLRAGLFNLALPVFRAMVIDAAPRSEHTIVSLVLATSENVGATAAPPLSGRAQGLIGYSPVFTAAALLYCAGALAFVWAARWAQKARKTVVKQGST